MGTAATPMDTADLASPAAVKVVFALDGQALYFSRSPIPYIRDPDKQPPGVQLHWRHLGIYAYRKACLDRLVAAPPSPLERAESLEQLRALQLGVRMIVLQTEDSGMGVDTPEDVAYVESLIRAQGLAPDLES